MSHLIGKRAIVVGGGFGGLAAAFALSSFFERVTIFERDVVTNDALPRRGVPQGHQLHALLAGGRVALEALDASFGAELLARGAVRVIVGFDLRDESPVADPFPRRDLGFSTYAASRGLIEAVMRERCLRLPNVHMVPDVTVYTIQSQEGRVCGMQCKQGRASLQLEAADLVIDASGAGELTRSCVADGGMPAARTSRIAVDIGYATATFQRAQIDLADWKACRTQPDLRQSSRIGLLMPLEEGRCYLALGGQGAEAPPGDPTGFKAAAERLRTPTLANAIRNAEPAAVIRRFRFPESRRHHYEELRAFPLGLVPIGDAFCRFTPTYGQGMSVAAQEALCLRDLLRQAATEQDPMRFLRENYLSRCAQLIETPWHTAALPDLLLAGSRGQVPANLQQQLTTTRSLQRMAAEDAEVHQRLMKIQHLVEPRSTMWTGSLGDRMREWVERDAHASGAP